VDNYSNFFINIIKSVCQSLSVKAYILLHSITLVLVTLVGCLIITNFFLRNELQNQIHDIGSSLSKQTAYSVTGLVVNNNISLLTMMLGDLQLSPQISSIAVYDLAGKRLAYAGIDDENTELFVAQITLGGNVLGQVNLQLNTSYFNQPLDEFITRFILMSVACLVMSLLLGSFLSGYVLNPIHNINKFLQDKLAEDKKADIKAKNNHHDVLSLLNNNIRELSTSYEVLLQKIQTIEDKEHQQIEIQDDLQQTPSKTAILVVRFDAQKQLSKLPSAKILAMFSYYKKCLINSAKAYQADYCKLSNGYSLLLFHTEVCGKNYLANALGCGELIRNLSHELQVEIAGTGITMHLCLAITDSDSLYKIAENELLNHESCQNAIKLVDYSRNVLLLENSIGNNDAVHQIAKLHKVYEYVDCFCVEQLLEPYLHTLEKHLHNLIS